MHGKTSIKQMHSIPCTWFSFRWCLHFTNITIVCEKKNNSWQARCVYAQQALLVQNRTNLFKYEFLFLSKIICNATTQPFCYIKLKSLRVLQHGLTLSAIVITAHKLNVEPEQTSREQERERERETTSKNIFQLCKVFILVDDFYLTDPNISHVFPVTCKCKYRQGRARPPARPRRSVYSRSFIRNDFEKERMRKRYRENDKRVENTLTVASK